MAECRVIVAFIPVAGEEPTSTPPPVPIAAAFDDGRRGIRGTTSTRTAMDKGGSAGSWAGKHFRNTPAGRPL